MMELKKGEEAKWHFLSLFTSPQSVWPGQLTASPNPDPPGHLPALVGNVDKLE